MVVLPVVPQLHVPLEGPEGRALRRHQRFDHVSVVDVDHDQRPDAPPLELCWRRVAAIDKRQRAFLWIGL